MAIRIMDLIKALNMTNTGKPHDKDIDMDQDTPIELKGSEQHHKLKNQKGEKGDPDHAEVESSSSAEIEDAVADGDEDTAIGAALKSASED
ncbi:hypothetical protein [Roseobacter weihaiensis]|uniref:hypothetical protein n=1 Tax=Roseobacter weihaiensis TaxID=2763262 RepID=UPI001D0A15EF|nr:hypothetical protein [Roseobacter sp. H9]